jgi:hypothetical protein
MNNTAKFTFRSIGNPKVLFTPQYMFDVEAMRQHAEYEEIDAEGNVLARPAAPEVKRVFVPVPAPAKKGRK